LQNQLHDAVKNDEQLKTALLAVEPLLLFETAEELVAGARCLEYLRAKYRDSERDFVDVNIVAAVDREIIYYVVGSLHRAASRTLSHLEDTGFGKAYEKHHREVLSIAASNSEAIAAEHTEIELFKNLLSANEKKRLVFDTTRKKGDWFFTRPEHRSHDRTFSFSKIREFIDGIRNHWLLRPAGIGVSLIAYDVAVASSEFSDGEISLEKLIIVAKELPSIPLGLAMIASPFVGRGQR
jgi:hypothetical protein